MARDKGRGTKGEGQMARDKWRGTNGEGSNVRGTKCARVKVSEGQMTEGQMARDKLSRVKCRDTKKPCILDLRLMFDLFLGDVTPI